MFESIYNIFVQIVTSFLTVGITLFFGMIFFIFVCLIISVIKQWPEVKKELKNDKHSYKR